MTKAGRVKLDQLRLDQGLDEKLPWGGRSPRALTRAANDVRFRREAAPLDEDAMLEEQYRRFLQTEDGE